MTDETTTVDEPAEKLMRGLLEASIIYTAKATGGYVGSKPGDKAAADVFAGNAMAGAYAGAAARLLHALSRGHSLNSVEEVAAELSDWLEFGEPIADWVGERATECGIDVDALIARAHTSPSLPPSTETTTEPEPTPPAVGVAAVPRSHPGTLTVYEQTLTALGRQSAPPAAVEDAPGAADPAIAMAESAIRRRLAEAWPHLAEDPVGLHQMAFQAAWAVRSLLVSPAAGRALRALQAWRDSLTEPEREYLRHRSNDKDLRALAAAVDAMVGDRPAEPAASHGIGAGWPRVAGRCPACQGASLFLGEGGHVTCSRLDCPDPALADKALHGEALLMSADRSAPVAADLTERDEALREALREDAEVDAQLRNDEEAGEPVPVPGSGTGWEREAIEALIVAARQEQHPIYPQPGTSRQLTALLADWDEADDLSRHNAEAAMHWQREALKAERERNEARAELAEALRRVDQLRAALAQEGDLAEVRSEFEQWADRDGTIAHLHAELKTARRDAAADALDRAAEVVFEQQDAAGAVRRIREIATEVRAVPTQNSEGEGSDGR